MKHLDKAEKKTLIIWSILGVILIIAAIFIRIELPNINKKNPKEKEKITYVSVKDYSRYYMVKSALSKFYAFNNANNYVAMEHILETNYKKENDVDATNVKVKLGIGDEPLDVDTRVMYYRKLKNGQVSYLVSGTEITVNTGKKVRKVFYEVILDGKKYLFSVKPITETRYMEAQNE